MRASSSVATLLHVAGQRDAALVQHLDEVLDGEALEPERDRRDAALELGQGGRDGPVGFSHRDHEQARALGDDRREMTQECERVFVGILQIVEHDDDGFGRDRVDRGLDRAEEPGARVLVQRGDGRRRRRVDERRDQRGEIGRERADLVEHERSRSDELREQLAERLVGEPDVGHARSPEHERAVALGVARSPRPVASCRCPTRPRSRRIASRRRGPRPNRRRCGRAPRGARRTAASPIASARASRSRRGYRLEARCPAARDTRLRSPPTDALPARRRAGAGTPRRR